jgi:hypothetical protein
MEGARGRVWQGYCFAFGMTDTAYDITHLLESELASSPPANLRSMKTPLRPATPLRPPAAPAAEDVLARELMQSAGIHEALIQQYLRMAGSV